MIIEGDTPAFGTGSVPSYADHLEQLLSPGPSSGGGFSSGGFGTQPASQAQPTSAVPTSPQTMGGIFGRPRVAGGKGPITQGIFGAVGQGLGQVGSDISDLQGQFNQAAGPSRSFQGLGGKGLISGAIRGRAPDTIETVRSMLGASYGGPQGLDQEKSAQAALQAQELGAYARELATGQGLEQAIGQARPGLTPGEAIFEAATIGHQPEQRRQAVGLEEQARALGGTLTGAQQEAQDYAAQRTAEESDIATKTRAQLEKESTGVLGDLDREAAARNAAQDAVRQQYEATQGGDLGSYEDLFRSENATKQTEAQAKRDQIMALFPNLKDYGLLEPVITKRGKEWYGMRDQETGKLTDIRKIPGLPKDVEHNLVQRQRMLEKLFGADRGQQVTENKWTGQPQKAPYRDVLPLYFEDATAYAPPDAKDFISLNEGTYSSPESTANKGQIDVYNTIQNLLGNTATLQAPEAPFQRASISTDQAGFQEEDARRMQEQAAQLDAAEAAYRKKLAKQRKRYKKQRGEGSFGLGGRVGLGLTTLGLSELARPVARATGAKMPDELVGNVLYGLT